MLNKVKKSLDTQNVEERKKLARYLKRGDRQVIADLAGVSRQTVSNWIEGDSKESGVGEYVIAYAEKRKKELEDKINGVEAA